PPTLARILHDGARRDVRSDEPAAPPVRWTTVATGQPSSRHGVIGYQAGRLPGISQPLQEPAVSGGWPAPRRLVLPPRMVHSAPVNARQRREPAVWEILAAQGVSAAAVNWWATWPASPVPGGLVVSDRAFARLHARRDPDRDVGPADLQAELRDR